MKQKNFNTQQVSTTDKEYYVILRHIGIFVFLNSLKEQHPQILTSQFERTWMYLVNDWILLLKCVERLKISFEKEDRWDIALDATSYYLFLRIYFDSFASIIHLLLKIIYPSNSRMWPVGSSFADQIKWFERNKLEEYKIFLEAMRRLGFNDFFRQERDLRNSLKSPPHFEKSKRMSYLIIPDIKRIRNNVGSSLFSTTRFSDFIGDYFLMHVSKLIPLERMEETEYGDSVGLFSPRQLELYKWFISSN